MYYVLVFITLYLAPFILALGFIQLFRGVINYFIIGPGYEEDRKEVGRHALLWAVVFFAGAFALYGITQGIVHLTERWQQATVESEADVDVTREKDLLKVPNVPMPR